jgi:hypothetical protein
MATLGLTLLGVAVPSSYTSPQAIAVTAAVTGQTCVQHDALVTFSATVTPAQTARFRWDWNNDGIYDTRATTRTTARHEFPDEMTFTVGVKATNQAREMATDTVTFTTIRCP